MGIFSALLVIFNRMSAIGDFEKEIMSYGMLAVPYLLTEVNNGNVRIQSVLNEILNTDVRSIKLKNYLPDNIQQNNVDWKNWSKDNQKTIELVKNLKRIY